MEINRRPRARTDIGALRNKANRPVRGHRVILDDKDRSTAVSPHKITKKNSSLKVRMLLFIHKYKPKVVQVWKYLVIVWKQQSRKKQVTGGVVSLVIVISLVTLFTHTPTKQASDKDESSVLGGTTVAKPSFAPIVPGGSVAETVDGRVAYDAEKQVVSYQSKVASGTTVTVSQQKSPESFKSNPDFELKKLAEQFSANQTLQVGGAVAYLGTSTKGPQTVVYYSNELLIFLFSTEKLSSSDWEEYIASLEPDSTL